MTRTWTLFPRQLVMLCAGLLVAAAAWPALADPPASAARISFVSGSASFSPAGSDEWVQARINRPIWIGDRLWSGDGRVELQFGGASLRLAPGTSLQVLNFDDRIAQFEVTQGSVALHVRALDGDDAIEIDTPTFAFVARGEGDFRIDAERDLTAVAVRRGVADVYGRDAAYRIDRRERFAFYSADLRDYDAGPLPRPDAFDRWVRGRAEREDRSPSARYVAPELVGYVDLDQHGEWRTDASFGAVWIPRVEAGWAPYRYGHWTWVDPWGWTWIDDAPWGFAPSHYGRWTRLGSAWAWVPGPRAVRPVYAPALVAWVGGENFSIGVSAGRARGIGWFPLAPGEIWRPAYDVSREYFTRVNVTNTVVNNTTVVNVYNNRHDVRVNNVDYRFRTAPAAVTAVPVETFVQSRPVQRSVGQLSASATAQANVLAAAPAQPVVQSIVGSAPRTQARPPAESMQRPVVARTAPPAAVPTIENRAAMVREGKPVDRAALERAAPPAQAAPQRPSGDAQEQRRQPPGATVQGAQARQLGANVRVVDAEKAQPKPVPAAPPAASRAARESQDDSGKPTAERTPDRRPPPSGRAEAPPPARATAPPAGQAPGAATDRVGEAPRKAQPPASAQRVPPVQDAGRPNAEERRAQPVTPAPRGQDSMARPQGPSPAADARRAAPPAPQQAAAPPPARAPAPPAGQAPEAATDRVGEAPRKAQPPASAQRVPPVQDAGPPNAEERRAQPVTPAPRGQDSMARPQGPSPAADARRAAPPAAQQAAEPAPARASAENASQERDAEHRSKGKSKDADEDSRESDKSRN